MSDLDLADSLSFTSSAPRSRIQAFPCVGTNAIEKRPPTRGGTVYDQYHKRQVTLADNSADDQKFKKTPEQMFDMKMQLKYGSPLVSKCMDWNQKTEWKTTMRPQGLERGIMSIRADGNKYKATGQIDFSNLGQKMII